MPSSNTPNLQVEVPPRILAEAQALVAAGWFRSIDEVVVDALRRYLDCHRDESMTSFVREDVAWGLRGTE
jgi:Arc/MetJ-type ribon-helix-helix transcriptional regulator